jgi:hypothetical protein
MKTRIHRWRYRLACRLAPELKPQSFGLWGPNTVVNGQGLQVAVTRDARRVVGGDGSVILELKR